MAVREKKVVLAGAGTMGASLAQVYAQAGWETVLWNRSASGLDRARALIALNQESFVREGLLTQEASDALLARIRMTTERDDFSDAALVVENIVEKLDAKRAFFAEISPLVPEEALLATNTSGLRISEIAEACRGPERFMGQHWLNPPHLLPLCEIIAGERTDPENVRKMRALVEGLGKRPVVVADISGFLINRLQFALLREALHIVDTGAATVEDVDTALKAGMGLRYAALGPFGVADFGGLDTFDHINSYLNALSGGPTQAPIIYSGFIAALCFMLAAGLFKIGGAPLHTWIPDVYQGAPTPVSAFLGVASKAAGFAFLIIILQPLSDIAALQSTPEITTYPGGIAFGLAIVAIATLLIGNLGAIPQRNAKRLLGYSSIGQAGFILAFFQGGNCSDCGVLFYLAAYGLATLPAFCAIALVRSQRGSEEISAFRGLARTNPRLAFLITVCFASLAGVPLTFGFLAKLSAIFFICEPQSAIIADWLNWTLLGVMIVCAAAGFYYYFKIIRAMYWEKPLPGDEALKLPVVTGFIITLCAVALLIIGTLPVFNARLFI